MQAKTLVNVSQGQAVGAGLTLRLARLVSVPVDDLLSGRYPAPGACPYCGHTSPSPSAGPAVILTAR